MFCHGCNLALKSNNYLKCNGCKSDYCFECLNLNTDSSQSLTPDQIKSLSCPYCRNVTRRINNDDTPCRQRCLKSQMQPNETMNVSIGEVTTDNCVNTSASTTELSSAPVTMDSISKLFDLKLAPDSAIMTSLRTALNKDIEKMVAVHVNRAIENLKTDFSTTTDFLTAEQSELRSEIKQKDNLVKQLQSEVSECQFSLAKLQSKIHNIEKLSRDMNLELHEVPESKNENLHGIFRKLCECLNVDIPESDIKACRRVSKMNPSSDRPRNILVTLSSQRLRDLFLSSVTRFNKAHSRDKLATSHIGFSGETRRIYAAEHLSPETKEVHRVARKFCRDNNFKFVWVRFGQIYIRKNEQSPALHIKTIDCLNKILL